MLRQNGATDAGFHPVVADGYSQPSAVQASAIQRNARDNVVTAGVPGKAVRLDIQPKGAERRSFKKMHKLRDLV